MVDAKDALLSVLPSIRIPRAGDRVHKDECAFSFHTPVGTVCPLVCAALHLRHGLGLPYRVDYIHLCAAHRAVPYRL